MTLIFDNGGATGGGGGGSVWTPSTVPYYSGETLEPGDGTYKDYEIDLSEQLPDDGAQYEVLFLFAASSGNVVVNSDIVTALGGYVGTGEQRDQLLVPVGTERKVTLRVHATTTGFYMNTSAYRKLG